MCSAAAQRVTATVAQARQCPVRTLPVLQAVLSLRRRAAGPCARAGSGWLGSFAIALTISQGAGTVLLPAILNLAAIIMIMIVIISGLLVIGNWNEMSHSYSARRRLGTQLGNHDASDSQDSDSDCHIHAAHPTQSDGHG